MSWQLKSSSQISQLDLVLQPTDTVPAFNECLLALSKHFLSTGLTTSGPPANKRCTSKPSPPPPKPTLGPSGFFRDAATNLASPPRSLPLVFYAVRLGHVPSIYASWKEAQPQTEGTHTYFKRFTSRQKAGSYMAMTSGPSNPLLDDQVAFLFTDGSALPNGTAGWGVHITYPTVFNFRGS